MACAAEQSVEKDFFSSSCEYVRLLSGEAKQRYISKLRYSGDAKQLPDPYGLVPGWSDDPKHWPDVTFGDVYSYLIEIPGPFTRESMKAYKSLEAYDFFVAGHVQPVYHNDISEDSPYCFLKAKVIPSQRVKSKPHEAWVCCVKKTGSVYCAHCTCMAGLGEVCSHVAALLFKIQVAGTLGLTKGSSTSEACKWNKTFRENS